MDEFSREARPSGNPFASVVVTPPAVWARKASHTTTGWSPDNWPVNPEESTGRCHQVSPAFPPLCWENEEHLKTGSKDRFTGKQNPGINSVLARRWWHKPF